jgi:hypothetical protein
MKCAVCKKKPGEIAEYVNAAKDEGISPEDFVRLEEGTYNKKNGLFYCTSCYVAIGSPMGVAELFENIE